MDETEIQVFFKLTIEIVFRNQIFQANCGEWPEISGFISEHVPPHC
jgi:hypothetical protein